MALALTFTATGATGEGRGTVSCSGAIEGSAFHFSCDGPIGGNQAGWLFAISSSQVRALTVSSPGGVSCEGHLRRLLCKGATIAANTRVAGTLTIANGGGDGEEEGEAACAGGVSAAVIVYGPNSAEEELEEEEFEGELEGPAALPVGRFAISSCRSEEGVGGGALGFGKVKLNRKAGTAVLPVKVPAAGSLTLSGKGIVKATKTARAAGTVKLTVRATGKAKLKLHRTGKATVAAKVAFTPPRGTTATKTKRIVLRYAGG